MRILMGESLSYDSHIRVGSHHYADHFVGDGHQVLWWGGPLHILNLFRAAMGSQTDRALAAHWRNGGRKLNDRFRSYHPLTLLPYRNRPLLGTRAVLANCLRFSIPSASSLLRTFDFATPDLLWLSQSHASLSLQRSVRYEKLAYRISDDYTSFASVPPSMRSAECEIVQQASVVFATAHRLVEQAKSMGATNVHYLPNGVDCNHFVSHAPEPDDLAELGRPRAVYVGSLREWFDVDLLRFSAESLRDFSFAVIGPVHIDLRSLDSLPNVRILGPRNYRAVPAYLRHSDVAIIPFVRNDLTEATNPVKIFEYFAAGLPVVAPNLHELGQLDSPAHLAKNSSEFVSLIRQAYRNGRDRPEFAEFASTNSWQRRFELVRKLCL